MDETRWQPPQRPAWVTLLNRVGVTLGSPAALVPLDEQSLLEAAKAATGLEDFGGDEWRKPFRILLADIENEANLTLAGRLLTRYDLVRSLVVRLQMAETEKRHLARFEELLHERRVRPTFLYPLWSVAGYAVGAATALLGERAAMACTVAVEEVIDEHYRTQADYLVEEDPELRETILSFRDDELAHREIAIAHGAEDTPGYDLIGAAVKAGSRIAIWLSTRF